jgi:hypothetical protein
MDERTFPEPWSFDGDISGLLRPGCESPLRDPPRMNRRGYRPALNLSRELRWVDDQKPGALLSAEEVVREIIEQALRLVDRLNKGKVPSHDYD